MNMEKIRTFLKGRFGGVALCVLEIAVGVLLLINPVGFTSAIIIGAGAVMALSGVVCIIRYFMAKPDAALQGQLLFRGLLLAMAGGLCMTQYGWFLTAFPLLTVLYAGWMLVLAAMRVQQMVDCLRLKAGRWYIPGIAAALAAVLAVIILINPFGAVGAVWTFVAVSLIVEAVMDLAGAFLK